MKKMIVIMLAVLLCLGAFMSGASAMIPSILYGSYWHEERVPMVNLAYFDAENRDWIEIYLLKEGIVEPNMGLMEITEVAYSIVGIQTVDPGYPYGVNVLLKSGVRIIETDLYLGDGTLPLPGERLYLTVGLTDSSYNETLGELLPVTVPAAGQVETLVPSFSGDVSIQEVSTVDFLQQLEASGNYEIHSMGTMFHLLRKFIVLLPKTMP